MKNLNEIKEMKNNLKAIISNHEELKNCYFWNPGRTASQRRQNEKRRNMKYENKNYNILAENSYSESCKNIYYKGIFYIDGKKTTVTKIKNIILALESIC